jgi:hypothetical protein
VRAVIDRRLLIGALAALVVCGTALGIAARDAGQERWRAETTVTVEDDGSRSWEEIGRATVALMQSDAVRDRAAAEARIGADTVAGRTTADSSYLDWRDVTVGATGRDRAGSVALLSALVSAAEAASPPQLRWSTGPTGATRDDPPLPLLGLLVLVGTVSAGAAAAFLAHATRATGTGRVLAAAATAACALAALVCAGALTSGDPSWFALNVALAPLIAVGVGLAAERVTSGALIAALAGLLAALAVWSSVIWLSGSETSVGVSLGDGVERRIFPSSFGHPGHYGAALAMLLPFAVAGSWNGPRLRRGLFVVAAVVGVMAIALTYARAAWIAALVGAFIALPTVRARLITAGAGIVVVAPLLPLLADRATTSDWTDNVRLDIWGRALEIVAAHPFLGVGVGGFGRYAEPVFLPFSAVRPGHAHNLFLNVAAESGVPALAALLAGLVCLSLALARGLRRRADGSGVPAVVDAALARASLGALAAIVVAGLLDVAVYQRYTLVLAGIVAGAGAVGAARLAGRADPSRPGRDASSDDRAMAGSR